MELLIFEALTAINVPVDNARRAAESIKKEIDERCTSHGQQLATRGDIESVRREGINWGQSTINFNCRLRFEDVKKPACAGFFVEWENRRKRFIWLYLPHKTRAFQMG